MATCEGELSQSSADGEPRAANGEEKRLHDKCKNALNLKSEDGTSVNK